MPVPLQALLSSSRHNSLPDKGTPSKRHFIRHAMARLCVAGWALCMAVPALAAEQVRIGVLAFRPQVQAQAQWQPLASALKRAIPEYDFIIEALDYPKLEAAVAAGKIEFVLTNPSHYVLMTQRNGLSAPLATLIGNEDGTMLPVFGGVVFALAGRSDIQSLSDLRGKTVAAVGTNSLGGYQTQANDLAHVGIRFPQDITLLPTGMPHDLAVASVLSGKADAGFSRTGVLEAMAREGKLDLAQLKIVGGRHMPGFPYLLSTPLYPEWPFAVLTHTDPHLAKHVAAALFEIEKDPAATSIMGIAGFTIPADYKPVSDLLQRLRLPPFDQTPHFTARDIWQRYRLETLTIMVSAGLVLLLGIGLTMANRRLVGERNKLALETGLRHKLLYSLGEGVYVADPAGACMFINEAALSMLGFEEHEVIGRDQHQLFHHHRHDGTPYPHQACPIHRAMADGRPYHGEEWFWAKDGSGFPVAITVSPLDEDGKNSGAIVVFRDITGEKSAHERDHLLVSALEAVGNGVVITDIDARIEWANPAFEVLTGYSREEVIGRKPSELVKSDAQSPAFYQAMWKTILEGQVWSGEVINRRKDGSYYHEELTIAPVKDNSGNIRHFVGIKHDISERKRVQERIYHMAQHDALTGLPNRSLFSDRMQVAMAEARRDAASFALLLIDLDKFKPVNDTFGHDIGDQLLKQAALRIRSCVRESDTVARIGGDEFLVMLRSVVSSADALEVADKIRHELALPFTVAGRSLLISSSTGIALYPQHGSGEFEVTKNADIAMYRAKEDGGNRVAIFRG